MDMLATAQEQLYKIPNYLVTFAPSILFGFFIFVAGRFIVRKASTGTVSATQRIPNIDLTLARFFGSIVLFVGMSAVIIFSLSAMQVNLAFLATIVAALIIALGFALQDSLGDLASGIMLAIFRPFRVGDEVEIGGEHGVVREMGLFNTRLTTRDNILISVGNGLVFGDTIKNYYDADKRRLDMDIGVSYDANINDAITAIKSVCKSDARIMTTPEPWAKVKALGDSAVNIQLRVWTQPDEYRNVKVDILKHVKTALDSAGIEIPYEHNVVVRREA